MPSNDSRKKKPLHHDLHVPLPPPPGQGRQARVYQERLRRLGYRGGIAFCHTAHGRLDPERDDADAALPWRDLLPPTPPPSASPTKSGRGAPGGGEADGSSFGRTNSHGTKIYRRLNIAIEEAGDASRILLPAGGGRGDANDNDNGVGVVASILDKYDVVSLQPTSEPALRNVCELLCPSSDNGGANDDQTTNNNARHVDIIVLEYATGSRGGLGLPFRLRKEYVEKALRAGATFELCYSAAVLDPKRRQGFLRALADFKSAYGGIQKKHMLLNKKHSKECNMDTRLPLMICSGQRMNYTRGTGDEGCLAFRAPDDVTCLVRHLTGVDVVGHDDAGWMGDDAENGEAEEDLVVRGTRKRKRQQRKALMMGPAERVLSRAGDRATGVVVAVQSRPLGRVGKSKRGWDARVCVVRAKRAGKDVPIEADVDDGKDDGDEEEGANAASLLDWLSEPMLKQRKEVKVAALAEASDESENEVAAAQDEEAGLGSASVDAGEPPADAGPPRSDDKGGDSQGDEEEEEDLEDGFIAF